MMENAGKTDGDRREVLREMLVRVRDETYERVKELRRNQEQSAETAPGDEMDSARSVAEVETYAGLIAREEEKLRFIDEAFARLEAGRYGICLDCQGSIAVERLAMLPFAAYCVDCQERRNRARRNWGEGATIPPYDQQWNVPEEMEEAPGPAYRSSAVEEELGVHFERPFGPEEAPAPPPARKRRGGGRKGR
jgi:DnaK suppressor protein